MSNQDLEKEIVKINTKIYNIDRKIEKETKNLIKSKCGNPAVISRYRMERNQLHKTYMSLLVRIK